MPNVTLHDKVPLFSAPMAENESFCLESYLGKWIVLFFYPKDNTPGCTLEAQAFSQAQSVFKQLGADIFGISRNSLKSHAKFSRECALTIPLISDEDESVCNLFGVMKDKKMFGKPVRGIQRSTFIINPAGVLVTEWRGVKVEGHIEEVLAFLKAQIKNNN
ncbi:MAG: peroxiredoxin [Pseudomonadota bacterium]